MPRIPFIFVAFATLVGCDPFRFVVKNDTNEPVKMTHRFYRSDATCHTADFMGGEATIAAKNNTVFMCPPDEISYIELAQRSRSCRISRTDLIATGGELKASDCFANGKFREKR
jgi:hypothetical protein